ncbi:23214_t:CDS:2 [Cetraspora pellucida]|uniref:non-specific serine/threonine protein kinase n=1 Tax=Cetraspora pellucida TaxID=1433469 RepID=A0A9N8W1W4_9GLOM|nr:23214_t:CDS:2 [Cetraspora pellucida]
MAPDVIRVASDRPYDTRVDIWSLGICVLELLTGKAAWGRASDNEIRDKLRNGEKPYGFQRLRGKKDDIGIGWEAIDFLSKCFIENCKDRWSAEKFSIYNHINIALKVHLYACKWYF